MKIIKYPKLLLVFLGILLLFLFLYIFNGINFNDSSNAAFDKHAHTNNHRVFQDATGNISRLSGNASGQSPFFTLDCKQMNAQQYIVLCDPISANSSGHSTSILFKLNKAISGFNISESDAVSEVSSSIFTCLQSAISQRISGHSPEYCTFDDVNKAESQMEELLKGFPNSGTKNEVFTSWLFTRKIIEQEKIGMASLQNKKPSVAEKRPSYPQRDRLKEFLQQKPDLNHSEMSLLDLIQREEELEADLNTNQMNNGTDIQS